MPYTCTCEYLTEKFYSFIKKLRKEENAVFPTFFSALILSTGVLFQFIGVSFGFSLYYLFVFIPFSLMILIIMLYGAPYPFQSLKGFKYSVISSLEEGGDIEQEASDQIENFMLCCLAPAPFFIIYIIYASGSDPYLAIVFQMLGALFIISSLCIYLTIFHLLIPEEFEEE